MKEADFEESCVAPRSQYEWSQYLLSTDDLHFKLVMWNIHVQNVPMVLQKPGQDYELLSRELLRTLRGRRSQLSLSRKLGYSTNTVYTWEAGSSWPTAAVFFRLVRLVGIDPDVAIERFLLHPRKAVENLATAVPLDTAEGVRQLLFDLMGRIPVNELTQASGLSRFSISRWLHGKVQPKLPDFLRFVEHASLRLLDLLGTLTDVERLPCVRARWRTIQAARAVGYDLPISHAVLRALELESYKKHQRHVPGFLADKLGISLALEEECLAKLAASDQIRKRRGLWVPLQTGMVDFRREPGARQQLKAFWARLSAERTRTPRNGLFAYNVFAVSRADLQRLILLQREYLRAMHAIIDASTPSEVVALANFQLFSLED